MRKSAAFCLFIFCLASFVAAQKPSIKWGREETVSGLSFATQIVGVSETGHYEVEYTMPLYLTIGIIPIKLATEKYIIKRFNKDLEQVKKQEFDLTFKNKKRAFHSCVYMKGNLYVFSRFYDKEIDINSLYVERINLKTLKAIDEPKLIAEIPARKKGNAGYFNTNISRDSSKLFVFYDYPTPRKKAEDQDEHVGISVYDADLNVIWQKEEITFDVSSKQFVQQGGLVDNDGNVIILGKAYEGTGRKIKEKNRDGDPNYTYVFRSFRENGEEIQDYTFELDDRFITDLRIEFDQNSHLACAGFYSNNKQYSTASGIFFFHLNPIAMMKYGETEAAFNSRTLSLLSRREATKKGELYAWDINKLILRRDGGAVILAEQTFRRWARDNNGNYYPIYYNMNILATSLNSLGEVEWVQVIPKKQIMSRTNLASSYNYIILPNRLALIFNDHEENVNAKPGDKVKNFTGGKKKGIVSLVSIDQQGELKREVLYPFAELKKLLMPTSTEQINNSQALIMIRRFKKTQRGRLTFK